MLDDAAQEFHVHGQGKISISPIPGRIRDGGCYSVWITIIIYAFLDIDPSAAMSPGEIHQSITIAVGDPRKIYRDRHGVFKNSQFCSLHIENDCEPIKDRIICLFKGGRLCIYQLCWGQIGNWNN